MFAQINGFSVTSLDELAVSPSQFDKFMNDALGLLHPIGAVYTATAHIVRLSFWVGELKETLSKKDFREVIAQFDWKDEVKRYLKVNVAFKGFTSHELAQVEPRTIFQIAENLKKYASVITQMKSLVTITQDAVRGFMQKCRTSKAKKEGEEATIWRMMPDNKRACVIGPIYNQSVGVILEEMVKKEGRSPQSIVEEALIAYHKSKYGCPVLEEVTQFVEVEEAPHVDVVSENQKVPASKVVDNETAPVELEVALETSANSWDSEQIGMEAEESLDQTSECNFWNHEEDVTSDAWSFEPEEKDDDDFIDIQSEVLAPSGFTSSTVPVSTLSAPTSVDLLIHTLQTTGSWEEISQVLKTHEEYKQQAWDALTITERRRVIELTPRTIKRLNHAKREGLIADFRELSSGMYEIRYNGCLLWETVFEYRIEEFFTKLISQSRARV